MSDITNLLKALLGEDVNTVNPVPESKMSIEEVRNRILAYGMNAAIRTYDRDLKIALDQYILSDLKEIMGYWQYLEQQLKLQVVTLHDKKIKELLTKAAGEQE